MTDKYVKEFAAAKITRIPDLVTIDDITHKIEEEKEKPKTRDRKSIQDQNDPSKKAKTSK